MTALTVPDEEDCYLYCILSDETGLDLAEFAWNDPEADDELYRAWDFQWAWYTCPDTFQVDQGARALGKSVGIQMRAFAFPFTFGGQHMLLTAPELNHLRPLTSAIEGRLEASWLTRELRPKGKSNGIVRQPHWECTFKNRAKLISRLPSKDGKGIKGMHVIQIELDEAQDYPLAGWIEITECLNRGLPGASWRCHGVPRGVRDRFYEITMGEDSETRWTVHRPMAMHRPTWSPEEREEKIRIYGGSRQSPDYRRNIHGEHGDAANPLFVLARLMACVDQDPGSEFNTDIYTSCLITFEDLRGRSPQMLLDLPGIHKSTWTLAPKGYGTFYAGMDVGATSHPSEILVFGQRAGTAREQLDMLLRVHMQRISLEDQEGIVAEILRFYGTKMVTFGIDKTGLGFDLWQRLAKRYPTVVKGYNFSAKYPVALEDRPLERGETIDDQIIERNIVEASSDWLREVVDAKGFLLPYDREVLLEWQGQQYTIVKSSGNPYGRREYSQGKFHTLDAGRMAIAGKRLVVLDEMLGAKPVRTPVLDQFVGAF
jgi:hypothetical protein